jgi:lactoylglutathione lyase
VAHLSLLVLKTHQLEALRRFYGTLGIEFVEERHGQGPLHFAGCAGDTVLEIYPLPDNTPADTSTRLGFAVPDLAVIVGTLTALGTPVIAEPGMSAWGLRAVVRDPDGRAVELTQKSS